MPLVKVFLVDDSAVVRVVISRMLQERFGFQIVGTAVHGRDALQKIPGANPEVVVLDVEMPELDGLATLRELMAVHPVPVVMLSTHTRAGSRATIEALALGAVDFVPKPGRAAELPLIVEELAARINAAAGVSLRRVKRPPTAPRYPKIGTAQDRSLGRCCELVVIGCSTGGPNALRVLLPGLPADLRAAVVVVQHMPPGFTVSLAEHLNNLCALEVRHAQDNDLLIPGRVLIAPSEKTFRLRSSPQGIRVDVTEARNRPEPGCFRPSVDDVMTQAAAVYGERAMGVLLTGMGRDGAAGMKAIQEARGYTIAQDEASCVVYGMPRAAVENGAARRVLPLAEIAAEIVRGCKVAPSFGR